MSEINKKYIAYIVMVVAVLIAGALGVRYPMPEQPDLGSVYLRLQALEGDVSSFAASGSGEGYTNLTSLNLSDDLYVGDDASIVGDFDAATLGITGAVDLDSTLNVDGATTFKNTVTVGEDGTSFDVTLYSDTAGDYLLYDQSEEALTIIGTNGQDALNVDDGNVDIADDMDVDGTANLDDVDIDGDADIDGIANLDAVDVDGTITGTLGVENVMLPTVASTSFTYTAAAGGTVELFTITDGEIWIVHGLWLNVTTNFDCTGDDCTANLGDGNDEDGFCVLADGELQTTDTEGTGWAAGWQCQVAATRGVYQDGTGGFWYAPSGADETIDVTLAASGDDFAAGAATAYIVYTRVQ